MAGKPIDDIALENRFYTWKLMGEGFTLNLDQISYKNGIEFLLFRKKTNEYKVKIGKQQQEHQANIAKGRKGRGRRG